MINIIIADDHAMMREGLKRILSDTKFIHVVGDASNGEEVLERIEKTNCNFLMMDMTMPGMAGVELINEIKRVKPSLPILVVSMHNTAKIAFAALRAGADGYLAKDSNPDKLVEIIRKIAGGDKYIEPAIACKIALEQVTSVLPHEHLSGREQQIFFMITSGKTINKIAEELFISPKTVSTHKRRIMEKMNFSNAADMMRYSVEHHLRYFD